MGRYTVGREVDDFVKAFLAAQKNSREGSFYDARARYYDALAAKASRRGDGSRFKPLMDAAMKWMSSNGGGAGGGAGAGAPASAPASGDKPNSGGGSAGGAGSWWTPERVKYATNYLEQNAGLSKYGAAGLVARWAGVESKDAGPTSLNPKSGAWGIAQWLGDRKHGIMGNDSFDDQLRYVAQELNGSEKSAAKLLRTAKSFDDGARGASMYERAEHYDPKTGMDDFTGKTPVKSIYTSVYGDETPAAVPASKPEPMPASTPAMPTTPTAAALPYFAQQPPITEQESSAPGPHAELDPEYLPPEYAPEQYGARGGMIRGYAEGGAVPAEPAAPAEPQEDMLPAALDGALRTIQDGYGLGEQPAIPGADPAYQQKVAAFHSNERAVSPEAMQALIERAGSTDEALRQIYGHFAGQGDMRAANEAATGVVQAARQRSMDLGQRAMQALKQQDFPSAAQALITAYNDVPDGQKVTGEVNPQGVGKAVVTDRAGKVVQELPLNPQTLAMFAQKFSDGSEYYGQLARFAKPSAPAVPQGSMQKFAGGALVLPQSDEGEGSFDLSGGASSLLAENDLAETAADVNAEKLLDDGDTATTQTTEFDGNTPSAVPVGGSAPGIEPPPYIPLDPDMTTEERRMVDSLNKRMQWTYQQRVQDYHFQQQQHNREETRAAQDRRAQESRDAQDRRARESRDASQSRTDQRIAATKENQRNAIKAQQDAAQRKYDLSDDGRAEKEERGSRNEVFMTDDKFGAPEAYPGAINQAEEGMGRQLDIGVQRQMKMNKDSIDRVDPLYATDTEAGASKINIPKAVQTAYDSIISEKPVAKNNQRSDGSAGTDPYAAPPLKLTDDNKKVVLNLATSIAARNPTVSPDLIVRAVMHAGYNPEVRDWGVDPKSKMFYVSGGKSKPPIVFSMSSTEFKQLMSARRYTEQVASEYAQFKAAQDKKAKDEAGAQSDEIKKRSQLRADAPNEARKNQTPWITQKLSEAVPVAGGSSSRGFLHDQLYGTDR